MALQLNLPKERTVVRLAVPAGYGRIVQVLLNADTKVIEIAVNVFADASAAARPAPDAPPEAAPVTGGVFRGKLGKEIAGLSVADCYNFLKTLPEFSGSVDV